MSGEGLPTAQHELPFEPAIFAGVIRLRPDERRPAAAELAGDANLDDVG
jgi:hypothetical protein